MMRDEFDRLVTEGKQLFEKQQYETALLRFELALEKSFLLGSDKDAIVVNEYLGKIYDLTKKPDNAIQYYKNNLDLYQDMHDQKGAASCLNKIGQLFFAKGDFNAALNYHMKSIEICKELDDKEGEAIALKNIGMIHTKLGNHVLALRAHTASLDLKRKIGDRRGEALSLYYMGQSEADAGVFDKARDNFEKALEIFQNMGLKDDVKKVQRELEELDGMEDEYEEDMEIGEKIVKRADTKLTNKFRADDFIPRKK
nr:tetratricopeptide repeat protein [Candidatus Sigynarchaeota archaeon]